MKKNVTLLSALSFFMVAIGGCSGATYVRALPVVADFQEYYDRFNARIVIDKIGSEIFPMPECVMPSASESRLAILVDDRTIFQGLRAVTVGSTHKVTIKWNGSILYSGTFVVRAAPEGLASDPAFADWAAAQDTRLSVNWQEPSGDLASLLRIVARGGSGSAATLVPVYERFPCEEPATLWWSALDAYDPDDGILALDVSAVETRYLLPGNQDFILVIAGAPAEIGMP